MATLLNLNTVAGWLLLSGKWLLIYTIWYFLGQLEGFILGFMESPYKI